MSLNLKKGAALQPLTKGPITREQLRRYAEASTDNNPIHLDEETAKKAGLPSVIAHGMLTMAFMGELVHQTLARAGKGRILEMSCRFKAMTFPDDTITLSGLVKSEKDGAFGCDLEARNQHGEVTATGHAVLRLS